VIRREVFEAIRFQDNLYGTVEDFYFDDNFIHQEDIECWIRIAIQTDWQIEGIPEALTLYRVNSGGMSAKLLKNIEYWERMIEKTRTYGPEVVAKWENPARAYQLRYLARRAVTLKDSSVAIQLLHRALATHWRILLEEPRRTLLTLAAAYLLWLLPEPFYSQLEALSLKITGASQKRKILQT
jgi:hypothetical protein